MEYEEYKKKMSIDLEIDESELPDIIVKGLYNIYIKKHQYFIEYNKNNHEQLTQYRKEYYNKIKSNPQEYDLYLEKKRKQYHARKLKKSK